TSGRLIQRNYSAVSLYDYYYNHAGASPNNSTNREVKLTDSGRTVYGGGGITPDEKIDSPKSNTFQDTLLYKSVFFHFASHYLANRTVDKNFQVDDAVMGEFKQYLTSQFGQLQGLHTMADWDPMIQKTLTFLPEAQALEDTVHKVLAQKAEARSTTTQ